MKKNIIAISREFGSGGRTIGKLVAEKLGIEFYDKDIIKKVAEESGLTRKYVEPVSYTHLDVYKRQLLRCVKRRSSCSTSH